MKYFFLDLLFLGAAYQDMRERKISNGLILFGLGGICIFRYAEKSETGILWMMASWLISILIFFPVFLIHAIGAGDVKLFSLIAAMHGLKTAFQVCVLWFLLAGIFSLLKLLSKHRLRQRLRYTWNYVCSGKISHIPYYDARRDGTKDIIPLAPFLAAAYGLMGFGRWRGIW